ncbi:MAG: hypothetical protein IIA66_07620 [Planctomycetes bacterium]|nr:hypothetical protein [Planctomycetota bacterium]
MWILPDYDANSDSGRGRRLPDGQLFQSPPGIGIAVRFPRGATVRGDEKREITNRFADQLESTMRPLNKLATASSSYVRIVFK